MKLVQEWIGLFLNTYTFIALLNYSALPTFRQTDHLYIYYNVCGIKVQVHTQLEVVGGVLGV